MRQIIKLDRMHRILAMLLAVIMVMSVVPVSVFAASSSELTTDIEEKNFVVGTTTEFTFTTTANDDLGKTVIGTFEFSDPDAIEKLEYRDSSDGSWYEFDGKFGPESGFPMSDATSHFRVTFKSAGVYTLNAAMKLVENGVVGDAICSVHATVTVTGKSLLTTTISEKTFIVDEEAEFSFTTIANDDANAIVIGKFEFSDPSAVSSLKYKDSSDGSWKSFNGSFGPESGFPMSDATSYFKASFNKAGKYTVKAYMESVETGNALCYVTADVTVKMVSELSYTQESIEISYSDSYVSNDLTNKVVDAKVTFSSDNTDIVTVNEYGFLTPVGIGTATITAERADTEEYVGSKATYTVTVVEGNQNDLKWTNTLSSALVWCENQAEEDKYANTVEGGSGDGNVKYTSENPEIATVDETDGTITMVKPGTAIIVATKDGNGLYKEQTAQYTLEIDRAEQTELKVEDLSVSIDVKETYTNMVSGGSVKNENGEIAYEFESSDETVATVDSTGKVTGVKNGAVTITVSVKGNEYYKDAEPATYTVTVVRIDPEGLGFENGGADKTLVCFEVFENPAINGNNVVYSSSNEKVATVDGNGKVKAVGIGDAIIYAVSMQDDYHNNKEISYKVTVVGADPQLEFEKDKISVIDCEEVFSNKATAAEGAGEIKYSSSAESVATVLDDGTLYIKKACDENKKITITATVKGNNQYSEAEKSYEILIIKADQKPTYEKGEEDENGDICDIITFNDNDNIYSNKITTNATEKNEGIEVAWSYEILSGENIIEDFNVETGEFKILGAGTVKVTASFGGNERYNSVVASYVLVIEQYSQKIAFDKDSYVLTVGSTFEAPTASVVSEHSNDENIKYSIEDKYHIVKSIDKSTGEITFADNYKEGEVVVLATKPGDNSYTTATATYTLQLKFIRATEKYYQLSGDTLNTSGWYTGPVTINADEGYLISSGDGEWSESLVEFVKDEGVNNVTFYVRENDDNAGYIEYTETIKIDGTDPAARIVINNEEDTTWDKILTIITLGNYEPPKVTLNIKYADSVSGVDTGNIQYYIDTTTTEVITDETELEEKATWETYVAEDGIAVENGDKCVVYAKVTDKAGNCSYPTTNGVVFDGSDPEVEIEILTECPEGYNGYYDQSVKLKVNAEDMVSGIASVTYQISGGNNVVNGTLFEFEKEEDTPYSDYVFELEPEHAEFEVSAEEFNCDNINVTVTIEDNAGNTAETTEKFNICTTVPTLSVTNGIDADSEQLASFEEYTDEGETVYCYNSPIMAKVVVTCRTSIFNLLKPTVNVESSSGSDDTYEIYDWTTQEDSDTHTLYIKFKGSDKYSFSVNYTDIFGNNLVHQSEKFAVDTDDPTATVIIDESNKWNCVLDKLTFGLWSNNTVTVKAETDDATSNVKSVEYFKSNSDEIVNVDSITDWQPFESFSVSGDERFTVYLKVTDYAGHVVYVNSDGYIIDTSASNITLEYAPSNENGYYNGDLKVNISVTEPGDDTYSGIKKVEYWVENDGEKTQGEMLYSFDYEREEGDNSNGGSFTSTEKFISGEDNDAEVEEKSGTVPSYDQLKGEYKGTVIIDAKKNNSDNVKLYVKVTDNAGNESYYVQGDNNYLSLKFDVDAPVIKLTYDNDVVINVLEEYDPEADAIYERGYFNSSRKAKIEITERSSAFNEEKATNGITVTALDANGEAVTFAPEIKWKPAEGTSDVHTAYIDFDVNANYTVSISYTDEAGNSAADIDIGNSTTPFRFTVDNDKPTAMVTIDGNTWYELLETITFGLYNNDTVYISAEANDATSMPANGMPTISCYRTDDTTPKSETQLDEIKEWEDYTGPIEISDDERMIVYLKVTDTAGNYDYFSSDGYIVDMTDPEVELTAEKPNENGIYNDDVDVLVSVNEPLPYSGIKKVEYWVTKDGVETQRETLYEFTAKDPAYSELENTFSKTFTVDSVKNNSCDVDVYVGVTDNAGNYVQKTLADLDIDITPPSIRIFYNNDSARKIVGERGYFDANRTATVVITERTEHFDAAAATAGIKITAKDANGKTVIEDVTKLIGSWKTSEGSTPDAATHTANITYNADANYTFAISYTDRAGKVNSAVNTGKSVTPYEFTVDKTAPTGTVKVGELGTWNKLIGTLTFGLWSKNTVTVSGTSADATSPIESVSYYKTSDTAAKTEKQLTALAESSWTAFKNFNISANEQFTVYIRIVDFAGNVTYISTNGIIVDNIKPDFLPAFEETKPDITLTPVEADTNGIYKSDVTVAVNVDDPMTGGTYSGIKEIRYEVINMGTVTQNGVLYSFNETDPTQAQLLKNWKKNNAIVVDGSLNNSNDVKVKVYAVDNAGNTNEDTLKLKIDTTAPSINITYDNNSGNTAYGDTTYFKANRTATIVVTERNFNADDVKIVITNEHGVIPAVSDWNTIAAGDNGDSTTNVATVTYSADGDYTFDITYTDRAGNTNDPINYGASLAPVKFTIDKTMPEVSVSYDNNDAQNGNYYKDERVATITVKEHNFDVSGANIKLNAEDDGKQSALPEIGKWISNGDVHTVKITYSADSLYTFDFEYNDKAGNAAADLAEQKFYVDKTAPTVSITDIVDESANNSEGNIGFVITAKDTNFDVFAPVLTLTDISGNSIEVSVGDITDIENGKVFTVENIDDDGIYRITCTVVDKAGNAYTEVTLHDEDGKAYIADRAGEDTLLTFSVNRNGSAYELDENTADLISKYYVQNITEDIVVIEVNADALAEYTVTLNDKELTEGEDYTVTVEGGDGSWMKYTYTVNKSLFEAEGEYNIVVSSKDKADNDTFSDVKDATVKFVVDRTAPVVTVTGLATNGRYQTESQTVTVIPTDDGGALNSLIVRLVDKDGNLIKELVNLSGEALATALEEDGGKITFTIGKELYQNIQIICNDNAVDSDNNTNTYDVTYTNVSVSNNAFMIFWANKVLRWSCIAGLTLLVAAIIFFVIIKRKKRKEKSKA